MNFQNWLQSNKLHIVILQSAAGLAVGFWGLSKLLFAEDWVGPYQDVFYTGLPINFIVVYVLGAAQIVLGAALIFDFKRKLAAWIAAGIALISLVATFIVFARTGFADFPSPIGITLTWYFFNPIAIFLLLVGVALIPEKES